MLPTLSEAGDIVAVEQWTRQRGTLQRGDVVLLRSPQDPAVTVCKRIIAMVRVTLVPSIAWSF